MKKEERQHDYDLGKDEMNLLEYSVFSSSSKVDRKTTSVVFTKDVWCKQKRRLVERKLTMAFSGEYGRPTTRDDQLYVALLKKTFESGFRSPKVYFTRYELLRFMGWSEKGRNYQAIDDGFNRICGTFLNWENAYWDKSEGSWVDRKFHIIDDVKLYSREKFDEARIESGVSRPRSWFKWSDVLFESFQAGYIKSLNMDVFRSLEHDMAKKIYRYVDKHFNNKNRRGPIEIPLEEFAVQKLGFKRTKPSKLRDMLIAPIDELVAKGHLRDIPASRRFGKADGVASIRFERPASKKIVVRSESKPANVQRDLFASIEGDGDLSPLADELVSRGMTKSTAIRWAEKEPEESARQIEFFDFKNSKGWKPESSSGGYLNRAITERFSAPDGFKSKAHLEEEKTKRDAARKTKALAERKRAKKLEEERAARRVRELEVEKLMNSLPREQQSELENEALLNVTPLEADIIRKDRREDKLSTFRVELWQEHIIPKHFSESSQF